MSTTQWVFCLAITYVLSGACHFMLARALYKGGKGARYDRKEFGAPLNADSYLSGKSNNSKGVE